MGWNRVRRVSTFLDAARLRRGIVGTPWDPVDVVASTGSTNADLAARARDGAASGSVLVSAHQSAGRGRFDRVWQAPPDTSVAVSVLVRPRSPMERWGWLSMLAGMAVTDALRSVAGLDAGLKWPNDVLVGERKICGILSEAVPVGDGMAAVVGMGLNVALTTDELPVPTATSVRLAGSDADAADLVAGLLVAFDRWYGLWESESAAMPGPLGMSVARGYRERCLTLGQDVSVRVAPADVVTGVATGIDDLARLIVRTESGVRAFAAGDVVHLRRG